ncbi:MAG: hypothetical protein EKK55_10465 [Rhodocyclaceae bacterium]|nr:MAG: hypothetical protein EKK55_10465 [Rhodocyclaceae bacterium]
MPKPKSPADETKLAHPSYGVISLARQTGGARRLFGSVAQEHHSTVALRIHRADFRRSTTSDRTSPGDRLIEVVLSSAQFVEMFTTMNVYSGTPCTITWFEGGVEEPPEIPSEASNIREEFRERMAGTAESLAKKTAAVMALLPASLNKKTRREIQHAVESMVTEVSSNIPFFLETFRESTEKYVKAAKAEVDAVVTHAAQALGLPRLVEIFSAERMVPALDPVEDLPQLTAGSADNAEPSSAPGSGGGA